MRYRLLASYQGAPYEAGIGPTEADVVLFAACPPPEDLRFEPATGHWRKSVSRSEVQTLHESRPVGVFRGDACVVLDDLGDRLHIVYLGHDAIRAAKLGYWEIDRGVFELITPRHEVSEIVEQRLPLAILDGAEPATDSWPGTDDGVAPVAAGTTIPGGIHPVGAGRHGGPVADSGGVSLLARSGAAVAVPPVDEPPLPLEAEARKAAASRRAQDASAATTGISEPPTGARGGQDPAVGAMPSWSPQAADAAQAAQVMVAPADPSFAAAPLAEVTSAPVVPPPSDDGQLLAAAPPLRQAEATPTARRRRATKRRMPTQRIFAELAALASIPSAAYAIGEDVDGALCLLRTDDGFEVFHSAAGARHEVRVFADEESAYFYLFGVLVADAVRTGALAPRPQ